MPSVQAKTQDPGFYHDEAGQRFVREMDPRDAFVTYEWQGDNMILTHIEVASELRGTGIGARFAGEVFDTVADRPHDIRIACPFMRKVASSNPTWANRFGLSGGA